MNPSIQEKLVQLSARHEEVGHLLSDPATIADNDRFRDLSREYAQLQPVVDALEAYQQASQQQQDAAEMLAENDPELKEMAADELRTAEEQLQALEQQLKVLLLPRDPNDDNNIFLEVRAGTGGDEAAIFAGDLFRMYARFAESQRWQIEVLSANDGEHGGFKEIIARVVGDGAYSRLKFESGVHRVQRVPEPSRRAASTHRPAPLPCYRNSTRSTRSTLT